MKNTLLTISLVLSTIIASATPFITRWDLSKTGTGANQISFNDTITGTVNYTWETVPVSSNSGSGTLTNLTTTITGLPTNAIIKLKIDSANFNDFNLFNLFNLTDKYRLVDVEQWGTVNWTSMYAAFYNCNNLNISATDLPNLSSVSDMSFMFYNCSNLNGPNNINSWNTSNVTFMSSMFAYASSFNQPIGNWNTGNVTYIYSMFDHATSFNQPIGNWNTSNVWEMSSMFYSATSFNQPIGNWNTSHVYDLATMFAYATSFNQPIGNWNTSATTYMDAMFDHATSFNQPIGNWNTGSVMDMSSMFDHATSFNQPLGNWRLNYHNYMAFFLDNSGMDCHNYAASLQGWTNNNTARKMMISAVNIHYGTNAVADRNILINVKLWNFYGDIADTGICIATIPNNTSLSSNITYFYAQNDNDRNIVEWNTVNETDMDRYEVERSIDGINFAKIATTKAVGKAYNYVYYDETPIKGENFYRIKIIEITGKTTMTKVVTATVNSAIKVIVTPNPTQGTLTINCTQAGTFTLYNMLGQAVYTTTLLGNNTKETKTLPSLPAALYNYILTAQNGERVVGKLEVE